MEHLTAGNSEAAIAHFDSALKLDPCNDHAWFLLGMAHFRRHAYEDAEVALTHCLESNPVRDGVGAAYAIRFMTRVHLGNLTSAKEDFLKAVRDPSMAEYFHYKSRTDC